MAKQCNITKRTAYNIIHAAIKTLKMELIGNVPAGSRISFNPALLMLFFFL